MKASQPEARHIVREALDILIPTLEKRVRHHNSLISSFSVTFISMKTIFVFKITST
jgi:hypothetical protein